ncbi:B-box zinc finger protein 21 [Senna tora]|uniref:B-box zinc finger protein 21 n=1 Tax=Senna tora TaxID=362788 RepID=A0A834WSG9_9FABA|nr:B-box zinc finger protein 21 [Senna tora]
MVEQSGYPNLTVPHISKTHNIESEHLWISKLMKIQCDVCNNHEASLFCTADEAALCDACDHRVHHANKLASKHHRFSLHRPCSNQSTLCDVCLERRAFMFCQQDRAILCSDCDMAIHSANEHTQKHDRFLLSGIKLSSAAKLYSSSTCNLPASDSLSNLNSVSSSIITKTSPSTINKAVPTNQASVSTSSISEYLMETLPGWQLDDFLDSSSLPFAFSKGDDMLGLLDADVIEGNMGSLSPESMGIWVPQAPAPSPLYTAQQVIRFQERETKQVTNIEALRSRSTRDDNYLVPQISPPSNASKRPRLLC